MFKATVLFKIVAVNRGESLGNDRVAYNRPLIYEAFSSENILFVSVEPINGGLACLRNHKLLQNQIYSSPVFDHVGDEHVFAEVDASVRPSVFAHRFQDILGRYNTLWLIFLATICCLRSRSKTLHLLVNELANVQNSYREALNDKLIRDWVRVYLTVLCVQELRPANDHGCWHEHLELVLRGDLRCL